MKKSIKKNRFCVICLFASLLFSLNFMGCDNPSVEEPDDSTQTEQSESEDDSSASKPTTETTPTTTTEEETDVSENPIKFTISIPASTNSITIERREVNKSTHLEISDWMTIATKWIENGAADYATAKNKDFTERYDIVKGHCYEYRVWTYNNSEGYGYDTRVSTNLGYHVAGYDGNKIPEITNAQFPLITYSQDTDNIVLTVAGTSGEQLPITCHNDEEIENVTYNYSYGWKVFSYFNSTHRTETISKADLRNGNNLLTSFNYSLSLKDEYFNLERNIDVYSLNMEKIPFSIPGKLIEGADNVSNLSGIYMEVSRPNGVVQVHIDRSDDDGTTWQRVGFNHYSGNQWDLKFIDFFHDASKTYKYRARFVLEDWITEASLELGTITAINSGYEKPSLDPGPQFNWNASTKTLSITNSESVAISYGNSASFETILNACDGWTGVLVLSYKFNDENSFWPNYVLFGKNLASSDKVTSVSYSGDAVLSSDSSKNSLYEYNLSFYIEDYISNTVDYFGNGTNIPTGVIANLPAN